MKTEPETFSIDDLERVGTEPWSGVRSPFARGYMRQMQVDDAVLFYHSSTEPPGVAGLARVTRVGVIDETQFDPDSPYFDPRATRDKPIWDCVDVAFVARLPHYVSLARLRAEPALANMVLFRQSRLSVQPATAAEYAHIVAMADQPPPPEPERKPRRPVAPKRRKSKAKPRKPAPKPRAKPKAKRRKLP